MQKKDFFGIAVVEQKWTWNERMNVGLARARGVLSCDGRGVVFLPEGYMSTDSGATSGFRLDRQFSVYQTEPLAHTDQA